MNQDEFEGKWKQLRGETRAWWGKLTDDDVEQVGGKFEKLVGVIQEKYGYARQQAETEVDKRIAEHEAHKKQSDIAAK